MASRTLPNLGLAGFWELGEDNYKDEMDLNLLKLSVLTQGGVISKLSAVPGGPSDGDVHLLDETAGGSANKIAVRDAGAWVYFVPLEGWLVYVRADNEFQYYDGTEWTPLGVNLPDFDPVDDAGKVLAIKLDGSGFEWVEATTGGGGGGTTVVTAARWRIIGDAPGSDGENFGFGEIQWIDPFGDQIFESGVITASSFTTGFDESKAIDGNYDAGNGWKIDPYEESAVGAYWEQSWVTAHTVAGVMLYPITGDFESAGEGFRAQYYEDGEWKDAGTFTAEWLSDSQQYFPFTEGGDVALDTLFADLDPGVVVKRESGVIDTAHTVNNGYFMGSIEDGSGEKVYDLYPFGTLADLAFGPEQGRIIYRGASVWDSLDPPPNDGNDYVLSIVDGVIAWALDTGGSADIPHTIGFGYGPPAEANEVVFAYVFVENVQWADEIVGSYGYQGVVTTATYNLTIQKNGSDIGVIQFQNSPSISFGITGSSPIDWAPGDVLTVVGAATPDDTLGEVAVTFYGTRIPES